jgi:tRNA(fMet)-specific endonuclease VapC
MARCLLDTNICIYIAKRKPPEVRTRFESLGAGDVAMSLITYGELLYGAARSATAKQATATIRKLIEARPGVRS